MGNTYDRSLKSDLLLLLTALIWGLAFVAQRAGMEFVGPFLFNGIRFALGALVLLPFIFWGKSKKIQGEYDCKVRKECFKGGLITGLVLFIAASLQQTGIVFTTAANAGFITSLYVIIVPVLGVLRHYSVPGRIWAGSALALPGLFLLSVTNAFEVSPGDILVFGSAVFWAVHVMAIARYSPGSNPFMLSFMQFAVCSLLSLLTAIAREPIHVDDIISASIPILYGGVMSVGIAYTLQVAAQRKAHPAAAAIILSLESLFAAIGGWLIINEAMSGRAIAGGMLLLAGVIISQLNLGKIYYKIVKTRSS